MTPPGFARFRGHVERCQAGETLHEARIRSERAGGPVWHQMDLTPRRDAAGMDAIVAKPIAVRRLLAAMQQVLNSPAAARSDEAAA